jgi:hypothetical protein
VPFATRLGEQVKAFAMSSATGPDLGVALSCPLPLGLTCGYCQRLVG